MLLKSTLFACLLAALPAQPETVAFQPVDQEDEAQPGIIQFAGLVDGDTVTLDGEEIPNVGLRRTGYNLLIAPGVYTLKVRYAESGRTCTSRVVVPSEQTVEPSCARQSGSQLAD